MMKALIILVFLTGCSTFNTPFIERDFQKSTKKICLSSSGKGRLTIQNNKYIFSYESALSSQEGYWKLALNFPLRKTETFELNWSEEGRVKFDSTIEEKILKENTQIDPRSLEKFTSGLGRLLEEIIELRSLKKKGQEQSSLQRYKWSVLGKKITASRYGFSAIFSNLHPAGYFGLMSLIYRNSNKQNYKMDLVVRECLEKSL